MALNQMGMGLVFTATDLASGVMAKVRNGFAQTRDELGHFGPRSKQAFQEFGLGMAALGAGAAGLATLSSTVTEAGAYEKRIKEISTLTEEATLNHDALYDAVLDMNAAYGGGTAKQAKALYDGISAGAANAQQATALMHASNKLAVAGVTDVGTALDGLTSSLNAYGVDFSRATEFSDAMFTVVRKGKTTIGELAPVIGRVAPTASALGVSFTELLASFDALTSKGIGTEEAVTGIKGALSTILHPAAEATAEASRLGIKFNTAALRSKGLAGMLREITSNSKFGADTLKHLFGSSIEGLNAALSLTAEGGALFNGALDAMQGKAGATDRAFKTMETTLNGQRYDAAVENAKIIIGDVLRPMSGEVTKMATRFITAFNNMPLGMREFLVKGAAVASTALMLVGGFLAAKSAILIASAAMQFLGVSVGGMLATFAPAVLVVGVLAAAFYGLRQAYDKNLGGFGTLVNSAVAKVSLAWRGLVQLFTQGGFSGEVRAEMEKAGNGGVENFVIRLYVWGSRIQEFFSQVADGFKAAITAAKPAFDAFSKALDGLVAAFAPATNDTNAAGAAFESAGAAGRRVGEVLGGVVEAVTWLATGFITLVTWIAPVVKALGSLVGWVLSSENATFALNTALVLLASYGIVTTVAKLYEMGAAALAATGRFIVLQGWLLATGQTSIGGGIVAGLRAIMATATAALGPIGAITLALGAWLAAGYQLAKLYEELDDQSSSQLWSKLKNDLGITSDAEFAAEQEKRMGMKKGWDENAVDQSRKIQKVPTLPAAPAIGPGAPGAAPMPTTATAPAVAQATAQAQAAAGGLDPQAVAVAAAQAASAAAAKQPANADVRVTLIADGQPLAEVVTKHQAAAAGRQGIPIPGGV